VESERQRLGENHPLFLTQYRLLPVRGGGGLLSVLQREQLRGDHSRLRAAAADGTYVAGIDLAGEAEDGVLDPDRDAIVVTIAALELKSSDGVIREPSLKVVEHYRWTGKKHTELYAQLVDILKNVWHCRKVVVDATGLGEPVASFLRKALGNRIEPFVFTQKSKSELGFNLLASINSGRLKLYNSDGSEECRVFWEEMEAAKASYRPNQTMNFYVEPNRGHDDFLMSLALVNEAGRLYEPRSAKGIERS